LQRSNSRRSIENLSQKTTAPTGKKGAAAKGAAKKDEPPAKAAAGQKQPAAAATAQSKKQEEKGGKGANTAGATGSTKEKQVPPSPAKSNATRPTPKVRI
jgi:hypothetical protein